MLQADVKIVFIFFLFNHFCKLMKMRINFRCMDKVLVFYFLEIEDDPNEKTLNILFHLAIVFKLIFIFYIFTWIS